MFRTVLTRIQNKNADKKSWDESTLEILPGEIVAYAPDEDHAYTQLKMGVKTDTDKNLTASELPVLNPQARWTQTDKTQADYIIDKPELGTLASKDVVTENELDESVKNIWSWSQF